MTAPPVRSIVPDIERRPPTRRFGRHQALLAGLAFLAASCAQACGTSSPSPSLFADADWTRLHAEAAADLARWADAVAAARKATGFVPVGDLTGQIGDWEPNLGDAKVALLSGLVEPVAPLPTQQPPDGSIQWSDGTSTSVPLMSAAAALDEIRSAGSQPCSECRPLRITGARLVNEDFATSRGTAVVPMWAFSVEGSAVEITRVAVASRVTPIEPSIDPNDPPIGISIDQAWLAVDGRTLSVGFVGCGDDHWAEAVESDLAAVVIVHEVPDQPGCARLMGYAETAKLTLVAPLGDRTVLEVRFGQPVPVNRVAGPG